MDKILLIDSDNANRKQIFGILGQVFYIQEALNGQMAVQFLKNSGDEYKVVLVKYTMADNSGPAVLNYIYRNLKDKIPVIVLTENENDDTLRMCLQYGVSDFIKHPYDQVMMINRIENVSRLVKLKSTVEEQKNVQNDALKRQYKFLQMQAEKLQHSNEQVIEILGTVVESRSLETSDHVKRIKGYCRILGERLMADYKDMKLTPHIINIIVSASALHDIGKIAIPDSILLKPAKLTKDEFDYMKSHTTRGGEIIQSIRDIWDEEYTRICYEACRWHHERYDGRGYPDGLVGDDIPISAQIISLAEVYDALVHERVYKAAFDKDTAFHMIITGECGVFSPRLLESFRKDREKMENLKVE